MKRKYLFLISIIFSLILLPFSMNDDSSSYSKLVGYNKEEKLILKLNGSDKDKDFLYKAILKIRG